MGPLRAMRERRRTGISYDINKISCRTTSYQAVDTSVQQGLNLLRVNTCFTATQVATGSVLSTRFPEIRPYLLVRSMTPRQV